MSRTKGTFSLTSNIEPKVGAPLDARTIVKLKTDLTASGTFDYPYKGLTVFVEEENKKYTLIGLDTTVSSNWIEESASGGHIIENNSGTDMTQRTNLQFVDANISDDSTNDRTKVENIKVIDDEDELDNLPDGMYIGSYDDEDVIIATAADIGYDNSESSIQADTVQEAIDLLSELDPSNYIEKSSTAGLVKNDGSIDTTAYAKQSEMSVTNGTGSDVDKTTIQLKTGTSATVLKSHQDISGKADKSEMSVSTSGDQTTIQLKNGTSATVINQHQDISGKVDKVAGKQLSTEDYTTAEKTKLSGISTGANKTEASTTNGNIKIDSVETPVYRNYGNNTVLTTDKTPFLTRQTLNPTGFSGYVREKLVGASYAWNQLVQISDLRAFSGTSVGGLSLTNNNDGSITISGTTNTAVAEASLINPANRTSIIKGHKYFVRGITTGTKLSSSVYLNIWANNANTNVGADYGNGVIFNAGEYTMMNLDYFLTIGANNYSFSGKLWLVCTDLTLAFGSTIADYLYGLSNNGGITKLRDIGCPIDSYTAYGNYLVSSKTKGKFIKGFNQWDEQWEVGTINKTTGEPDVLSTKIRTKNFMKVFPNTNYYFCELHTPAYHDVFFYDKSYNYIGVDSSDVVEFTTPLNTYYMKFTLATEYGVVYNNDICINISDANKNGTYEPYSSYVIDLGNDELRGVFQLVDNEIVVYGDVKESNGKIGRNFGIVDLGSLTWTYNAGSRGEFGGVLVGGKRSDTYTSNPNAKCSKYYTRTSGYTSLIDKSLGFADKSYSNACVVTVNDSDYTDAASFKAAMSGVYLIYELATPTIEQSSSFADPISLVGATVEEYIDEREIPCPIGHETQYMGQSEDVIEIPSVPSTNGKRVLTSYKSGDDQYLSWEKENGLISGNDRVLYTDNSIFLNRETINPDGFTGYEREKLIGASYAWNQLVENGNFASSSGWTLTNVLSSGATLTISGNKATITSNSVASGEYVQLVGNDFNAILGHKYLITAKITTQININFIPTGYASGGSVDMLSGYGFWNCTASSTSTKALLRMANVSGSAAKLEAVISNFQIIDLTLAFGSDMADKLYALANNGGIALMQNAGFPIDKYTPYGYGLYSVKTSGKKISGYGKNLFDKDSVELGAINTSTGADEDSTTIYRTKGYIYVKPNTQYYISGTINNIRIFTYSDSGYVSTVVYSSGNFLITTGSNITKVRFHASTFNSFKNTMQMELGSRATEYEEYKALTYPLGNDELRGKFDIVNSEIVASGDVKKSNGEIDREWKQIDDLGSLEWTTFGNYKRVQISDIKTSSTSQALTGFIVCEKFVEVISATQDASDLSAISLDTTKYLWISNNATPSGKMIYKLATPTTEQSTPFADPMSMVGATTEEYIDDRDIPCPICAIREYMGNSDNYIEFPSSPSSDGKRKLVAETSGGKTQYYFVGDGHTYSTQEQRVGTWIDGKSIYEKVIVITSGFDVSMNVAHGIENLKEVIDISGRWGAISETYFEPLNAGVVWSSNTGLGVGDITATNIFCKCGSGIISNLTSLKIILRYTKTTD